MTPPPKTEFSRPVAVESLDEGGVALTVETRVGRPALLCPSPSPSSAGIRPGSDPRGRACRSTPVPRRTREAIRAFPTPLTATRTVATQPGRLRRRAGRAAPVQPRSVPSPPGRGDAQRSRHSRRSGCPRGPVRAARCRLRTPGRRTVARSRQRPRPSGSRHGEQPLPPGRPGALAWRPHSVAARPPSRTRQRPRT